MKKQARIIGTGTYLPERVLTNADLEKMVDTSDEWIVSRTGMKERRLAADEEYASTMGAKAAEQAMKSAGVNADQIDFILVATSTADYVFPSTAAIIQSLLKTRTIPAVDLQAACTGFLYGLEIAKAYIESGMAKTILVIATEKLSSIVNYKDRTTCVLFGDGAAAAVVSDHGPGLIIKQTALGSDGEVSDLLMIPAGGSRLPASEATIKENKHYILMQGQEVFKHAVRRMEAAAKSCLEKAQMTEQDITWLIPHQANERIIDAMGRRFDIPIERVMKTVHKYGNTSASGIAIALHELLQEQEVLPGNNLLLVAFGAGFTWGAVILTQEEL